MFKSIQTGSTRPSILVLGIWQDTKRISTALSKWKPAVQNLLSRPEFSGKRGQVVCSDNILLIGLGKKVDLDLDEIRLLGGSLVHELDKLGVSHANINIHLTVPRGVIDVHDLGQALGEGMIIANWRVDFFDGVATRKSPPLVKLKLSSRSKVCEQGIVRGLVIGVAVNDARRVAATPPNICNPTWMAKEAKRIARKCGLRCNVISFSKAKELGLAGLVNVGKGSESKPCLIILEHRPRKASKEHICFVGKTITYDTGGYSLKINNSMKGMKYDKNGGMAVLGAMEAITNLKVPMRVTAILPCAENMVSSNAYRPDDIIKMYNGVTVEVTNTDAEGRLVLADGLAWACKQVKPTSLIELSTLTGGVVVALGSFCAGLWCNDTSLRKRIEQSARNTGERVWRMPLWEDHRDFMRAKHADIHNSAPSRDAHPIQGAAFLSFFVDDDIPWAHIDIAGVSSTDRDQALCCTGPTGWGVRLLLNIVESWNT
jgi:leucyl aminopeptidase